MLKAKHILFGLVACAVFAQAQEFGDSKPVGGRGTDGPAFAKAICTPKGLLVAGQNCAVASDSIATSLFFGKAPNQKEYVLRHVVTGSFTERGAQQALVGLCQTTGSACSGEIVLLQRSGQTWRAVRSYPQPAADFYLGACFRFTGTDGRTRLACRTDGYVDEKRLEYLFNLTAAEFGTRVTATRLLSFRTVNTCEDKAQRVVLGSTWTRKDLDANRQPDLEVIVNNSPQAKVTCNPLARYDLGQTRQIPLAFVFDGRAFKPTAQTTQQIRNLPAARQSP